MWDESQNSKTKKGESYIHIETPDRSVGLEFKMAAALKINTDNLPEDALIVANVYFVNKQDKNQDEQDQHPCGISFLLSKDDARDLLKQPDWKMEDDGLDRDQWVFPNHKLMLEYSKDLKSIGTIVYRLSCMKP